MGTVDLKFYSFSLKKSFINNYEPEDHQAEQESSRRSREDDGRIPTQVPREPLPQASEESREQEVLAS